MPFRCCIAPCGTLHVPYTCWHLASPCIFGMTLLTPRPSGVRFFAFSANEFATQFFLTLREAMAKLNN